MGQHVVERLDDELGLLAVGTIECLYNTVHHVMIAHDGHDGIWR